MTALLQIAARSAWNRRGTLALVVLSIALATALLLGLERLRNDIRGSFTQSVSGTDLIVGARTGPVQLMLYAVFSGAVQETLARLIDQLSPADLGITNSAAEPEMTREEMNERIAEALEIETDRVNVKATTTEKLGFVGRREGIAAQAVVMVGPK